MGRGGRVAAGAIQVEGLAELRSELRKAGGAPMARGLSKAAKSAAEIVAAEARKRATARGGSAAKGAKSITARGRQTAAIVSLGGARAPWMLGAEYGSLRYRQFPPWRGSGSDAGYFLWPAIRDTREEFLQAYAGALEEVMSGAFPRGGKVKT